MLLPFLWIWRGASGWGGGGRRSRRCLKSPSFETLVASPWAFRPQKPDGLLREGGILWGSRGVSGGVGGVGGGAGSEGREGVG